MSHVIFEIIEAERKIYVRRRRLLLPLAVTVWSNVGGEYMRNRFLVVGYDSSLP